MEKEALHKYLEIGLSIRVRPVSIQNQKQNKMTVTVIERVGSEVPDSYWKQVLLYLPWKTDYLMLRGLTFEDGVMFLN